MGRRGRKGKGKSFGNTGGKNKTMTPQGSEGTSDSYSNIFPALPNSGTNAANGGLVSTSAEANKMRIRSQETTQVFCIPSSERRYDMNDRFGESESTKICQQIMKDTNTSIETSVSKDKSLTFVITGKPESVVEARRRTLAYFQVQTNVTISVPKSHHRSILGKNGDNLRALEKATGTKITIPPANANSEVITVIGHRDGVEKAIHEIKAISDEKSKNTFMRVNIPKLYHPFICGANNEKISALIKNTNTRINVPPPSVNNDEITVLGEKKNVEEVCDILNESYENAKRNLQTVTTEIPKARHKYLVGARKIVITEILERTGCTVEVPPIDKQSDTVVIRGPQTSISDALSLVFEKANSMHSEDIQVPTHFHRFIIGKKGVNIRELQEKFKEMHIEFSDDKITVEAPADEFNNVKNAVMKHVKHYMDNYDFAELSVKEKYVKHIIGKNGVNVNRLKAEHDVNISIVPDVNPDRLRIEGLKNNVAQATVELSKIITRLEHEVERIANIDQKFHRTIIGSRGERIKEIQEKFRVVVNFPSQNQNENCNVVKIRGLKEDTYNCHRHLMSLVKEINENSYTLHVPVYKQFHKYVIGKDGATIRKIKEETGTKIELPSEGEESDTIIVIGKKNMVEEARDRIQKIQEEMESVISKEVTIPIKYHSMFFSQKYVDEIRENCGGVQIKFPPSGSNSDKVTVRGPSDDVAKAKSQLLNKVSEIQVNNHTVEIKAKPELHKHLIGKGGANVTRIKDSTGVRINFPSSSDSSDVITVIGRKDAVLKAKAELMKMIREIEHVIEEDIHIDPKLHKHFSSRKNGVMQKIIQAVGGNDNLQAFFPKGTDPNDDKVTLRGEKEVIEKAKQLIQQELTDLAEQTTLEVIIVKEDQRSLYRLRGTVESDYNVTVIFPPKRPSADEEPVQQPLPPSDPNVDPYNVVRIKGKASNCEAAKQKLLNSIPVTRELLVNSFFHMNIIGMRGENISRIRKMYDVSITLPQKQGASDPIIIKGLAQNVENAKQEIMKVVEAMEKKHREEVIIDRRVHSRLIGSSGKQVHALMKEYNVDIRFPKEADIEFDKVLIFGDDPQNVIDCKEYMIQRANQYVKELPPEPESVEAGNNTNGHGNTGFSVTGAPWDKQAPDTSSTLEFPSFGEKQCRP